jgi:hypothetical protein
VSSLPRAKLADDLVRRLAAAIRGVQLYAPAHPLVARSVMALAEALAPILATAPSIAIGIVGDDLVVGDIPVPRAAESMGKLTRQLRQVKIERIVIEQGVQPDELPQLHGAMPHAYVEMHPEDAAEHGLRSGELALIKTRRGELRLPVWIGGRGHVPRGSLFIPFFDERLLCNDITLGEPDPISKEPDYKKCAAAVLKASGNLPARTAEVKS